MQRSRLKNIINKSKTLSKKQEVGNPFDEFKKSLPKELVIDEDNYRLEAAWKAYGSPKDYKHALWEGMIQPIDEDNYKLPSIGYNEETDEYEYLNKGEDNETVAKDIRVWDNDVIPFVKELKHGGYIRKFNKEKDCWTYTKNSQKEDTLDQEQINIQKEPSGELIEEFKSGGKKKIKIKTIWDDYIEVDSISDDQRAGRVPIGKRNGQDLYINGDGMAAPLNHTPGKNENGGIIDSFKQGGQMNVIPEGALHARKNNMEGAGEDFTSKGIPVVDNQGEQQAEIEREEVIFTKDLTEFLEENMKKYNEEDSDKDAIAIKVGKRLTKELLTNTDDRTNLIEQIQKKI